MDYKYIEQLLERYWQCETSLQEEEQLRSFFTGEEVPEHLLPYQSLFVYQKDQQEIKISDDFEECILAQVQPVVKAKRITLITRFIPLLKAAAMVAIVLSLGGVIQQSFFESETSDYNYDAYADTYDDPEVAYKQVSTALIILSESMNKSKDQLPVDSLTIDAEAERVNE